MSILYVNTGSSANKGDGDSIRLAFDKINRNFGLLSGVGTDTITINNLTVGSFLGTSTFDSILVRNTATIVRNLFVGEYVDEFLRAADTAGIYSNTTTPRNLDFRLFNNYDRGNTALKLTDPLTYSSFIIKHKNGGSSSTLDRADENYIYSDSPAGVLNVGRYSDIYLWANQDRYYDTSATHAPSVFINSIDGSVDILKDFYLGGLPFYITSSGTAYANGIPISGSIKVSDTAPADAIMGSLWYDTVDGRMYVDYDGSWVDASPQLDLLPATTATLGGVIVDGITIAINTAGVISSILGGSGTFTDVDPPTAYSTGTLWYDSGVGRLYVYFDNTWVDASPAGGSTSTVTPTPAFRVNGGGASATDIAPGTLTNVNFVVDYNQGDHLNTSTGIFTAPQAGIYSVFFNAKISSSTSETSQVSVFKNGSTSVCFWEVVSTGTDVYTSIKLSHMAVSAHTMMVQGDTLQANVVTGSIDFDTNGSWGVALIG